MMGKEEPSEIWTIFVGNFQGALERKLVHNSQGMLEPPYRR